MEEVRTGRICLCLWSSFQQQKFVKSYCRGPQWSRRPFSKRGYFGLAETRLYLDLAACFARRLARFSSLWLLSCLVLPSPFPTITPGSSSFGRVANHPTPLASLPAWRFRPRALHLQTHHYRPLSPCPASLHLECLPCASLLPPGLTRSTLLRGWRISNPDHCFLAPNQSY